MTAGAARGLSFFVALLGALASASGAAGCCNAAKKMAAAGRAASLPPLPLEPELYADARATFRSKLRRHGPAPQPVGEAPVLPASARDFAYRSDGLTLTGWVSREAFADPGAEKRPGVVFLHGGFGFDEGDWVSSAPYRKAGFVVMTPVLRGENGQPGDFSSFYDEVTDVLNATMVFRAMPGVDPDRLFVAGHSAGGTLAMLAALSALFFRAGASFSGSPDQRAFFTDWPDGVSFDESTEAEYSIRSPIAYATSFRCPFRLYFGSEESFFSTSSAESASRIFGTPTSYGAGPCIVLNFKRPLIGTVV